MLESQVIRTASPGEHAAARPIWQGPKRWPASSSRPARQGKAARRAEPAAAATNSSTHWVWRIARAAIPILLCSRAARVSRTQVAPVSNAVAGMQGT